MGLNDLQSHITQNIENAVDVVDLLRLGRNRFRKHAESLKLVVDGECCLDRLYGGFYPDWVCGGQWDRMYGFLQNFASVLQDSNLDLVIFLNGSLEPEKLHTEWKKNEEERFKFLDEINRHVTLKKKPPPKIWWVPPAYLRSAVRLAFRTLDVKMMCTLEDHHKDIIRFTQRNNFNGIIADDLDYLVFDTHRYFSAQKLKLTFKGSLETVEVKIKKIFDGFGVSKDNFVIFAVLMGNHILREEDLTDFYSALEVDKKSKSSLIEKVSQFIKELGSTNPPAVAEAVVEKCKTKKPAGDTKSLDELTDKIIKSLQYYSDETIVKNDVGSNPKRNKRNESKSKASERNKGGAQTSCDKSENGKNDTNGTKTDSPKSSLEKLLYRVNPDIESTAMTRHKTGLMSPFICQILQHREIKLPAVLQDTKDLIELPNAHDLFRPLRQRVYAILFNLHHLQFLAKQKNEKAPTIEVKETYFCLKDKTIRSKMVPAVELGWGVPTVERLWLGDKEECKSKRIKAFLTMVKSDKPEILDSSFVPQQMIILACVLRYILSTEKKLLRQSELEAFVAQAFIQDLTDPNIAQDIEISNLSMRGVHLSHLFMEGVEMALLANDACGAPVPFMLFCPWYFFNGKIFNYIMEQQALGKTVAEICGYKVDLMYRIGQMKDAITEGIKVQYAAPAKPPPLFNGPPLANSLGTGSSRSQLMQSSYMNSRTPTTGNVVGYNSSATSNFSNNSRARSTASSFVERLESQNPFTLALEQCEKEALLANPFGNHGYGFNSASQRGQGATHRVTPLMNEMPSSSRHRRVQPRGGHLEVAGMIVGSWEGNYGSRNAATSIGGYYGSQSASANVNPVTRVLRNPRGPVSTMGYQKPEPLSSLFDQMNISNRGGSNNKGSNSHNARYGSHQSSNPWSQKRSVAKTQKKTLKKGKSATNSGASGGSASNNKKEVTFSPKIIKRESNGQQNGESREPIIPENVHLPTGLME